MSSSTAEILIPGSYKVLSIFLDNGSNTRDFRPTKSSASLQSNGSEPEFGHMVVALHVHMEGFLAIAGVEIEPVRSSP